jgi:phosphatidylserine/phosphatidylglycerophosphate/cardiolipin synthase-like enzyme
MKKILSALLLSSFLAVGCSNNFAIVNPSFDNSDYSARAKNQDSKITFVANQDYLPALLSLLNRNDLKTVDILHYNFFTENGGAPEQIINKLIELQAKGVKIRIQLEGNKDEPNKRNSLTLKRLTDAGITAVKLSSGHTTHNKSICVNSRFLLIGSTNWTKTSIEKNNETNALIDSEVLSQAYISYLDKIWVSAKTMINSTAVDGDTKLLTDTAYYGEAINLINRAETSIDIGTYFLAYRKGKEAEDIKVKALLDAIIAKNNQLKNRDKNFKVRFFLDNNGISPEHYQNFTVKAALNARDYLAKNGITEFYFDKYKQISHCKFIIKDAESANSEVLFGSTNLYKDDFDDIHQVNIISSNSGIVRSFYSYMNTRLTEATKDPVVQ